MKKITEILVFTVFSILSILLNINLLPVLFSKDTYILVIPESLILPVKTYLHILLEENMYSWNPILSLPSMGLDLVTYRLLLAVVGSILMLGWTKIVVIERILIQFLAFVGAYLLIKYYINFTIKSTSRTRNLSILISLIGGLLYGISPSFMIGDAFWINIEFSYAIFPWIVWCFNKPLFEKNWKFAILCTILIILNNDEHFLWVGIPIFLALYSCFIFLMKFAKEKRICLYPILTFSAIIIIFVLLVSYKLITRFITFSPYSYALTKEGLDICWSKATMLNMLRAMSHMSLSAIYVPPKHPMFQFLSSLMPLTLFIPAIAFLALLFYRRNWVVIFYSILLIISILPFYSESPLKWMHYWIFFHIPLGPAFRTWRIPDAYISLSLSVLLTFSLYYIFEKLYRKRRYSIISLITAGILFLFCVYSWPLLTGDVNGYLSPVKVPGEYNDVYKYFRNISGDYRVAYVPDFGFSYGLKSSFKPFWSKKLGMLPIFLFFSQPTIPSTWSTIWTPYYKFTLSYYYWSVLTKGDSKALSYLLEWTNLKYLVIHNDIPTLSKRVQKSIQALNNSTNFKLVYHNSFIYVFENLRNMSVIKIPPRLILADGGYRLSRKLYDSLPNPDYYGFVFIDNRIPRNIINLTKIIITDKPANELEKDLLLDIFINNYQDYIIYPYKYVVEYNPKKKWSRATLLDAENQVWHPLINWESYSWDFDYFKGVVFTIDSKDKVTMPVNIKNTDKYILLVRYFANERGGLLKIYVDNKTFEINTKNNYNGFFVKAFKLGKLKGGGHRIILENVYGFNAVNLFVLIPEKEYYKVKEQVKKLLQNKTIIYLFEAETDLHYNNARIVKDIDVSNDGLLTFINNEKAWQEIKIIKNGTYRLALKGYGEFLVKIANYTFKLNLKGSFTYSPLFYLKEGKYKLEVIPLNVKNLVKNPSFEEIFNGLPKGWSIHNTKDFSISFDKGYKGKYSLKVITKSAKKGTWSWIRSEPIEVKPEKKYLIITHMKIYNANASHIVVEGWKGNKVIKQIIQCPPGIIGTGSYDWKEFTCKIKIPRNVDNIRIVLNAGWVLDKNKSEAITWFDNIQVIPLDEVPKLDVIWLYSTKGNKTIEQLFEVKEKPANITKFKKINPTLWKVYVNASKPFLLVFAEAYDPLWEARVYRDGKLVEKVRSMPVYGVINGFWINQTGNLTIIIRYVPQDWFELGLKISGTTFLALLIYLIIPERYWRKLLEKLKRNINICYKSKS